jgi:transcription elongation factor GreA
MLKKRIGEISIMNMDKIPHDRAAFGSTVHLKEDNGDAIVYQLVMPEEADAAKGFISTSSPIGRAIVGKNKGDEIQVQTPNGIRNFEIIKLITIHDEA